MLDAVGYRHIARWPDLRILSANLVCLLFLEAKVQTGVRR